MKHPTASTDLAGTATTARLDPSTMGTLAGALAAQRLRNDPDTRKPWVEPTVTECATTNRRPATLTIAGVDLPNPAPPAPRIAPTADEIHSAVIWLRQRASLQPVRSGEFEVVARIMEGVAATIERAAPPPLSIDVTKLLNDLEREARWIGGEEYSEDTGWRCGAKGLDGKGYAADMRAASAEIQRQAAEISELQGLLEEATPVARFVSELATLTDTEVDFMGVGEIRAAARGKIGEPYGFTLPRLYGDEDRKRAVADLLSLPEMRAGDTEAMSALLCVDTVASALGLREPAGVFTSLRAVANRHFGAMSAAALASDHGARRRPRCHGRFHAIGRDRRLPLREAMRVLRRSDRARAPRLARAHLFRVLGCWLSGAVDRRRTRGAVRRLRLPATIAARARFVMKALKPTAADREKAKDAAYERGWVDSLTAYDRTSCQPDDDIYCYRQGWDACANYRWQEPANRGRAPDPNFRTPRPCR